MNTGRDITDSNHEVLAIFLFSPTYGEENADCESALNGDLTPTLGHSIRHHRKVHHSLLRSITHNIESRSHADSL